MIQTKENIGKLLERFVQGLTTESEEQLLSDYFCTAEAIPEEWMVYKELFDSFSTDVYDFSEDEKDAMLARVPRKKGKSVTLWIWAVAACVVAVMALEAGNDLLLTTDYRTQIPKVLEAVENSTLDKAVIDIACRRVLSWKQALGLL